MGFWEIQVTRAGRFAVKVWFQTAAAAGATASLKFGRLSVEAPVPAGAREVTFPGIELPAETGKLEAELREGERRRGVRFIEILRVAER